ncbi:MAG: DUF1295 domain-containing protein [Hydrogenophilales bacterium]|nr:DUF1295 domain-containing protein [Hydrogenophilales bacterium]
MHAPQSVTHPTVALAGIVTYLMMTALDYAFHPFGDNIVLSAIWLITTTGLAIFAVDSLGQHVHLRASTGLDPNQRQPSWARTATKYVGLLGSIGFVGLLYWLFPEYHGAFYGQFYQALRYVMPVWLMLAIPYFYYIDRAMVQPKDGYWHLGQILLLRWENVDRAVLGQHILTWTIKGYFLPLMFTYLCTDLNWLRQVQLTSQTTHIQFHAIAYRFIFYIDVGLATLGYIASLRLFDTHVRSAEPTMLGWVVALVCYEPFWSQLISRQYINYQTGLFWNSWLQDVPVIPWLWSAAILLCSVIYVWATVMFGARFSNLTHRGILTNGPYRWSKHPAYLAKNLSWWLISVPFVVQGSLAEALRTCLLLLALNGIYYLRARTEEMHLGRDPDYVRYAGWIQQHGLFRFMARRHLTKQHPAQ